MKARCEQQDVHVAPPAATHRPLPARRAGRNERVTVWAAAVGTQLAVVAAFAALATAASVVMAAGMPQETQRPIKWINRPEEAVDIAKRTLKPILFHIPDTDIDEELEQQSNLETSQKATFRDPTIRKIAEQRFVPAFLPRSNKNLAMLAEMGAPTEYGMYLAVVTPDGELVGVIEPTETANPRRLAIALTEQYRVYRNAMYETQIKPRLDAEKLSEKEIRTSLEAIREFTILAADQAVLDLLEQPDVRGDARLREEAYQTLAVLATPPTVAALFERALTDDKAAEALAAAPVPAADELLEYIALDQPLEKLRTAYAAVAKIIDLKDPKPPRFWEGDNVRVKTEEVERVQEAARKAIDEWNDKWGPLR